MKIVNYCKAHPVKSGVKSFLCSNEYLYEALRQLTAMYYDFKCRPKIKSHINTLKSFDKLPLFSQIQIETVSKCSGGCTFCPVNRFDDPRPTLFMDEELFKDIIEQLGSLKFTGNVKFHFNNEPLLDRRIVSFVKYARKNLNAFLALWTNGRALTIEMFKDLLDNLDELVVNNYNDNLVWNNRTEQIIKYCKENNYPSENLRIQMRLENEKIYTRAGQALNRSRIRTLRSQCLYLFKHINVRPDGKVSLCSNDALGSVTLGDLKKESILDVWYGETFEEYREKIIKGRKYIDACASCDNLHYNQNYGS